MEIRGLSAQFIVYDNNTYRKHNTRTPTFHLCVDCNYFVLGNVLGDIVCESVLDLWNLDGYLPPALPGGCVCYLLAKLSNGQGVPRPYRTKNI